MTTSKTDTLTSEKRRRAKLKEEIRVATNDLGLDEIARGFQRRTLVSHTDDVRIVLTLENFAAVATPEAERWPWRATLEVRRVPNCGWAGDVAIRIDGAGATREAAMRGCYHTMRGVTDALASQKLVKLMIDMANEANPTAAFDVARP